MSLSLCTSQEELRVGKDTELYGDDPLADPNVPFCPDCGAVLEGMATADAVGRVTEERDLAEGELRTMRRQIANLKLRLEGDRDDVPQRDTDLFNFWVEQTGRNADTLKFADGRKKAIKKARKAGFEDDELRLAIRVAARFKYLVYGAWRENGLASDRKDDLTHIFKDETRIESLLALASRLEGE